MDKTLKNCPFCKGEVRIGICDDEGNLKGYGLKAEEYQKAPCSGVNYYLIHDENLAIGDCPIATYEHEQLGTYIYKNIGDLRGAWNNCKEV